jgi:hypothetical protein
MLNATAGAHAPGCNEPPNGQGADHDSDEIIKHQAERAHAEENVRRGQTEGETRGEGRGER